MELTIGTRLFTQDGRKVGNGIITGVYSGSTNFYGDTLWGVETDFGNTMKMSRSEIEYYYVDNDVDLPQDQAEYARGDVNKLDEWRQDRRRLVVGEEPQAESGARERVGPVEVREHIYAEGFPKGFVWINRPVRVRGEDFTYMATCLCSFPKTNGKVRYIVEDSGRLFVQRESQLEFLADEPVKEEEEGSFRKPPQFSRGCPHCGYHHPPDGVCLAQPDDVTENLPDGVDPLGR